MSKIVELFLSELAETLMQKLEEDADRVKRVVANLEVDDDEYKRLIVQEVISEVVVEATFACPPYNLHTPSSVREKALNLLEKILERDERLFCEVIP